MQVNKNIDRIVRRVLNEELGINKDVYEGANQILNLIRKDANEKDYNGDYVKVMEGKAFCIRGEFPFDFCGVTMTIKYNSYVFDDNKTYQESIRQYPKRLMNAYSLSDGKNIELYVVYNRTIKEGYDDSIYDRVQHELEHTFQTIKKEGVLADSPLRDNVNKGLRLKGRDNDIYYASWVLYCSRKYEQDACANGLYSWLCNGNDDKEKIVFQSALVKNRRISLKYLGFLESLHSSADKSILEKFNSFFGISLGQIIKKGYKSTKRMKELANRVIFKYEKDTGNKVGFIN